jgi:ribosome recycling factor
MIEDIKKDAKARMRKSVDNLRQELTKIRTGRAHPNLLDHVLVDYYGSEVPINQVANVTVSDPRTLAVTPWEKSMVPVVEKAIMASDLGLTPSTAGDVIRLPLPPLTEERRRELVRVVKHEGEQARVAIRNIRRDANHDTKELLKEKELTEDEAHHGEEEIQNLTDQAIAGVDEMLAEKEEELMSI